MSFEGQSATGSQEICDLFVKCIEWTYASDSWMPLDSGPDLQNSESPLGSFQFANVCLMLRKCIDGVSQ
jgi:hypothetical protein